ncbi:MAG: valine--tRNA ligase [Planctomycetes bacterium]|nr:valine--tRNA ligase [Planctomycetota bacterium]
MWESRKAFEAGPQDGRDRKDPFCMVIPPPNVTGALHLGHALNNTLQDILIRHKRMAGFNTFWLVGTDHAGIATQAVVEKTIRQSEGKSRHDLGREELVKRIWEWKEKFGGRIVEQLKLMGCSCDYSKERFTLDDGCAKAVRETFFKLFRDGLIYRGKRLVNWDTQLQTAVADDEVYHETVKGHFYHFKYPIVGTGNGEQGTEPTHVHIATTRPETMLADTAVAVHPDPAAAMDKSLAELRAKLKEASDKDRADVQASIDDLLERQKSLLPTLVKLRDMAKANRKIMLPLMNREIPLICDEWADPTLGTGCVKITPAHDANDYEVGRRHDLPIINVMTPDGRVTDEGGAYKGMKFADARKKVVEDMEALGLVEKIEDRMIDLGHSDRSKSPIEPYLSDQWFVRMGDLEPEHAAKINGLRHKAPGLAQMAIDAVKRGDVKFHPARYENSYIDWLGEKRDWCISRQLWWGHRIPVWHALVLRKEVLEDPFHKELIGDQEFSTDSNWNGRQVSSKYEGQLFLQVRSVEVDAKEYIEFNYCVAPNFSEFEAKLEAAGFQQDPDVLDTWFSSALWPHSTLGWPDAFTEPRPLGSGFDSMPKNPLADARGSENPSHGSLLSNYYPTQVLSTAREIITLWVARMVLTGLYNIGEIPFHDVYIHSVIQDGQGRKMSKSAGNGVDPADIIEEYGADALRFTLADLSTETQDIRMPVKPKKLPDGRTINISEKFEKGRNFCNKLWQASTGFVMRNLEGYAPKPLEAVALRLEDRWILSRMTACQETVDAALEKFRFAEAAGALYRFMWDEYCSWYIEMTKSRLQGSEPRPLGSGFDSTLQNPLADTRGSDRHSAQQVLVFVLDRLLRMLHPFIPFVTEGVWQELNNVAPSRGLTTLFDAAAEPALITAQWPTIDAKLRSNAVESEMDRLHNLIKSVRDIRADVNDYRGKAKQPSLRTLAKVVIRADADTTALIERYRAFVMPLAGCDTLEVGASAAKPAGAMSRVHPTMQVYAPVADYVDLGEVKKAESAKLEELRSVLVRETAKMSNEDFVKRADPGVVAQSKQRAADLSSQILLIEQHLAELS